MAPGEAGCLPQWSRPLAVVAHPDDESFGLGAVLHAFARAGSEVTVLCLTHGEASSLHEVSGDLHAVRERELAAAAKILGLARVHLLDHPDSALTAVAAMQLTADVRGLATDACADGLVVFDRSGVTGHPDHAAATAAALTAAAQTDLPVLEWTLPVAVATALNAELNAGFTGHLDGEIDLVIPVDRTVHRAAIAAHASQATPQSPVWLRLELLGPREYLRLSPGVPSG